MNNKYGKFGAARVFFTGFPNSWQQIQATYGDTPLVVSFKAPPSQVNSLMALRL